MLSKPAQTQAGTFKRQRAGAASAVASGAEIVDELLRRAAEADAAAAATLPSAEEERATIAAAEALAGSEAGVPAKSRKAVSLSLRVLSRTPPPHRPRSAASTPFFPNTLGSIASPTPEMLF